MQVSRGAVRTYLAGLRDVALVPGVTEHTRREPLVRFLIAAATELGIGSVRVHAELRMADVGQPDLQVVNSAGAPIGYGETKNPGSATDFARTLESEQVGRYRASLDNLLVTDFIRFAVFRPDVGRLEVTLVETPGHLAAGSHAVSQQVLIQLSHVLGAFFTASAPSATSAEQLADGLAKRATLMRDAIRALLTPNAPEGDALRRLWEFYRRSLMSDMEADDFADTYAQTLTYALFLARLESGPVRDLDAAWRAIPEDVPILRSAIEPLRAAGRLPDVLGIWLTDSLHLLASTPDGIIRSIGHPSAGKPDPILYFYEHFLAAYDKVERIRKGVYYTPRPLVDYLVRAVHETLKSAFGRPLGLADKGVRLLDPAAGTGTFLLAAAQSAVDEVASSLGPGAIRTVLEDHVLRDFYGFELLPAPYTIAHVKLALFARDHHVRFLDRRAPVYLTNTLGDPVARADDGGLLAFFVPGLIEEAAAAERVKAEEMILVVIGNPPWSASSHNKQPEIERLFAAWKTVDGRPGSRRIPDAQIALNDDYLKFLRWAVWKVVEQPGGAGHGIVALVTNHGFINGRIHRGIRKALIDAFDDIWVFNIHGNRRLAVRGRSDENVFPPVKQGVALTVLVRRGAAHAGPAGVRYREMRGTRAEKYAAASSIELGGEGWAAIEPTAPMWSFAPAGEDALSYDAWPTVPEVFPVNVSGIQTQRDDLVSDVDRSALLDRMRLVTDRSLDPSALVESLSIRQNSAWQLADERAEFADFDPGRAIDWLYRLFDRRVIYWDPSMLGRAREKVMRHLLPRPLGHGGNDRLALIVQRARPITTIATVTRGIASSDVTSYWGYVYPLRLAEQTDDEMQLLPADGAWRENLQPELMTRLAAAYGRRPSVEDVGWFVFGVLSAPAYRERFGAALAIDHPRIPFPAAADPFERLRSLGEELGRAHLLEAPVPAEVRFEGEGDGIVGPPRHDPDEAAVWINATQLFTGVPTEAWAWGGAFRPLEHFLTDRRGRRLDAEQIVMFQSAIWAVREAIRLAPALDGALTEVITATISLDPEAISVGFRSEDP